MSANTPENAPGTSTPSDNPNPAPTPGISSPVVGPVATSHAHRPLSLYTSPVKSRTHVHTPVTLAEIHAGVKDGRWARQISALREW